MKYLGIFADLVDADYTPNSGYYMLYNRGRNPEDSPHYVGIGRFMYKDLSDEHNFNEYYNLLINTSDAGIMRVKEYHREEENIDGIHCDSVMDDEVWELTDLEATIVLMGTL